MENSQQDTIPSEAVAQNQPATKKQKTDDGTTSSYSNGTATPTTSLRDKLKNLPEELKGVDFTRHITWGKYAPYPKSANSLEDDDDTTDTTSTVRDTALPIPLVPLDQPPVFTPSSPALCHYVHAIRGRARACTIHLKPQPGQLGTELPGEGTAGPSQPGQELPRPVPTPMFMPVGTKGCLKALTVEELMTDPALNCPIILANTYHMALQPGTELLKDFQGLHSFMGQHGTNANEGVDTSKNISDTPQVPKKSPNKKRDMTFNLLTDSGGFQMVSLAKLSQVTEEGVTFENPFLKGDHHKGSKNKKGGEKSGGETINGSDDNRTNENNRDDTSSMMLLRPEDSIKCQNEIGANIIMCLDDVVSSVEVDDDRFEMATYRTLRWYDRCIQAHQKEAIQNLFPIVQGGLDTSVGGLRERCLAGFRRREVELNYVVPGYAIGGLAGGESKDEFWRVVDQCCKALPDTKPRYLMGVGYPLDLVVCTALGVDMYDCVYPTRTARFGVALVPGEAPGTMRLKSHEFATDTTRVVQQGCGCQACHPKTAVSRARLHRLLKTNNPLAIQLLTQHNIAYMMSLVRNMRQAILDDTFATFVRGFLADQFRDKAGTDSTTDATKNNAIPGWVREALAAAGIAV